MGKHIQVTDEAYDLLIRHRREGFSIKRLASEPIVEKYKTYFAGNKNSLTATDSSKEQKDGTNRNFRME